MLDNRQASQQLHKAPHIQPLHTLAPFRHQHRICNFQRPYGRNDYRPAFERYEHAVRVFARLVRKTPGERYRGINHYPGQNRRPSLTISRTLMESGLIRFRSARIPSTTSWCVSFDPVSSTGTSIAAGTPCLVIVIFSPCLTRSSRSDRCVLASKAPTESICPPNNLVQTSFNYTSKYARLNTFEVLLPGPRKGHPLRAGHR